MQHHNTIKRLMNAVRELRHRVAELEEALDNERYWHQEAQTRQQRRLRDAEEEAERARREAQDRAADRDYYLRQLERARESGDAYTEDNALRRLRSL